MTKLGIDIPLPELLNPTPNSTAKKIKSEPDIKTNSSARARARGNPEMKKIRTLNLYSTPLLSSDLL
jgi:hypothetical protein